MSAPDNTDVKAVLEKGQRVIDHAVHYSSETGEWYTPTVWLERVCRGLGLATRPGSGHEEGALKFDLDPCGSPNAPAMKCARRIFTIQDDGLSQPWEAETLFMNPPYGRTILGWVAKLNQEFRAGHVKKAIALLPARTDTLWWQTFVAPYPVCFVRSRIRFEGDSEHSAPFPSAFVFYNHDPSDFIRVFAPHGCLYLPWRVPH